MNRRRAFSYTELLVVISLLGVMVAMLLPAIANVREAARRHVCLNNAMQLILAVQNYESHFECYPPGTIDAKGPILSQPVGYHHNWIVQILPYLEEHNTAAHVDRQVSVYHANNLPIRRLEQPNLRCPSYPRAGRGYSDYAGVHHNAEVPIHTTNNGVFFLNSHIRFLDVSDGTTHTLMIGEKWTMMGELGWMSGTRATLRNTGSGINARGGKPTIQTMPTFPPPGVAKVASDVDPPISDEELIAYLIPLNSPAAVSIPKNVKLAVGGFGSRHPGGAVFAMGDGSVHYLSETISPLTLSRLANRADGDLLPDKGY